MDDSASPRVSVLIPTLNEEENIQRAIDSVKSQSFSDYEIIVCDAGSSDDTTDIVKSQIAPDLRLLTDTNGLMSQYNTLCNAANGEYLSIFDADSEMLSGKLEKQVQVLDENPAAAAVGTGLRFRDRSGEVVRELEAPTGDELKWMAIRTNPLHHTTVLLRSEAVASTGGYRRRPFGDYDLMIRLAKNWELMNINEPLTQTIERTSRGGRNFSPSRSFYHNTSIGFRALLTMDWSVTEAPIALTKRVGASVHLAYNMFTT
ncbi:glycosyltransferase [Natrinema zhouii]|uniref:Glycosyltransferase family 2 protein n=1 Tax=Natrinema zhouii TaxID=1710539 RepID=A0A7D6CPV6_9EURY|nr:glycosyltransferase family 2 protein [Natrinema zhouii]QLK26815.1 glycosyltransferase [Natrinema zhouii]